MEVYVWQQHTCHVECQPEAIIPTNSLVVANIDGSACWCNACEQSNEEFVAEETQIGACYGYGGKLVADMALSSS